MERFSIDSYVRGYHLNNYICEASVSEELPCQCDDGNAADPYAVRIENAISLATAVIKRHARFYDIDSR